MRKLYVALRHVLPWRRTRIQIHPVPAPDEDLLKGVGDVVSKIPIPTLTVEDSDVVDVVHPVASYTWLDKPKPTIVVPGSPPVWRERSLPFVVEKDNVVAFVDQNGNRVPDYPLLPLVAAVTHMEPDFAFSSVEFVTDRNTLRKLLRWIRGREMDPSVKDFRFNVELVGKTLLFTRHETKTVEISNRGYGLGFEKAVTREPPAAGSGEKLGGVGHHRIVRYTLEGLDLLVRFELDACLPDEQQAKRPTDLSELLARLDRVGLSDTTPASSTSTTTSAPATKPKPKPVEHMHGIDIVPAGTLVPQSRTIELVTCSSKFVSTFSWAENYPQLFLSQTAHHFLGLHNFGTFSKIEKRTLQSLTAGHIGEEQQGDLKRLGKALRVIYDRVVEEGPGVLLSLACVGQVLTLRRRTDGKHALPDDLLAAFSDP